MYESVECCWKWVDSSNSITRTYPSMVIGSRSSSITISKKALPESLNLVRSPDLTLKFTLTLVLTRTLVLTLTLTLTFTLAPDPDRVPSPLAPRLWPLALAPFALALGEMDSEHIYDHWIVGDPNHVQIIEGQWHTRTLALAFRPCPSLRPRHRPNLFSYPMQPRRGQHRCSFKPYDQLCREGECFKVYTPPPDHQPRRRPRPCPCTSPHPLVYLQIDFSNSSSDEGTIVWIMGGKNGTVQTRPRARAPARPRTWPTRPRTCRWIFMTPKGRYTWRASTPIWCLWASTMLSIWAMTSTTCSTITAT